VLLGLSPEDKTRLAALLLEQSALPGNYTDTALKRR
jgi:hypothetical protein